MEKGEITAEEGSSPLARGLRRIHGRIRQGSRIIPARAGFTTSASEPVRAREDHPRSRGVYPRARARIPPFKGSSPLARGLQAWVEEGEVKMGIIPARAGFTQSPSKNFPCSRDHPRSRGVYEYERGPAPRDRGSSPLARGLPTDLSVHKTIPGIIPARAGFTGADRQNGPLLWDHPRSRGVYMK